ncbi:MAG: DUF885 family protein, partial [Pyrinomonadaceae bacterium]
MMVRFGKRFLSSIATLLLVSANLLAQDAATTKALHALFDREWNYQMEQNPTRASQMGDRRWNDRWRDLSLEVINRRHEHRQAILRELAGIDRQKLSQQDQLNYDLFKKDYESSVEEHKFRWY